MKLNFYISIAILVIIVTSAFRSRLFILLLKSHTFILATVCYFREEGVRQIVTVYYIGGRGVALRKY